MTQYKSKLDALRAAMNDVGVQAYLIPRADEFQGEFVAPYAERLKYISGFTGSAGLGIVTQDKAMILSDARYTLQLETQLDGALFSGGDYIRKPPSEWLKELCDDGDVVGYDPFLFTQAQIEKWSAALLEHGVALKAIDGNIVDVIWTDQADKPTAPVINFPETIAGSSIAEKLETICDNNADDCIVLTMPDSIAWLLNVRGSDVPYMPYVLSYAVINVAARRVTWFVDPAKVQDIKIEQVDICALADMPDALVALKGKRVSLDKAGAPIWFVDHLKANGADIQTAPDPCVLPRSMKHEQEQEAMRQAHIHDGVALVKFMRWLESVPADGSLSEYDVAEKLEEFRAAHSDYKGPSFPTICGFGDNGAIVHYRATAHQNSPISGNGLLLIDSGGQYLGDTFAGTTDITRTFAIGQISDEMRARYTTVLKGHINLARAKFPAGTTGAQIDVYARQDLWAENLDFAHGTGHGVGCYLSVHEEAASISPRGKDALKSGMILSNEPGYYKAGAFGIRIENLVLVNDCGVNDATGQTMLSFETISLAPFDKGCIDTAALAANDVAWLNAYHKRVYDTLSPLLDEGHKEWLMSKAVVL